MRRFPALAAPTKLFVSRIQCNQSITSPLQPRRTIPFERWCCRDLAFEQFGNLPADPGSRSLIMWVSACSDWVKWRANRGQEFVIGGYVRIAMRSIPSWSDTTRAATS
jgi:hypothetical protein